MKHFKQLALLLLCYVIGFLLSALLGERIPANILGMLVLLILLLTKVIRLPQIEQTSDFLLKNMAFFFLPACISILEVFPLIRDIILPLLIICVVTTLLTAAATAYTTRFVTHFIKKYTAKEAQVSDHV